MHRSDNRGMTNKPFVSVIIPTFNRARYVGETVESVLAQSYENIEVIVIDDGSTDNTSEVVSRYVPRVRYVWQENAERGASRNHGLRLASGELISFLDSDDLWLADKVEKDVDFFNRHENVGLLFSDAVQIDAAGTEIRRLSPKSHSGNVTKRIMIENFVLMATHMARTSLIRDAGGFCEDRLLSGSEDWELWVRLSTLTKFYHRQTVTAKIRVHESNTMGDAEGMKRAMNRAVELMAESSHLSIDDKKLLRRTRAMVSLFSAINLCTVKRKRDSYRALRDAVTLSPSVVLDTRFGYTALRNLLKN